MNEFTAQPQSAVYQRIYHSALPLSIVLCSAVRTVVSVQSAFSTPVQRKSLPLLPHRTGILSGREVSTPPLVSSPQVPPLRQSLPALSSFLRDSTVSSVISFKEHKDYRGYF